MNFVANVHGAAGVPSLAVDLVRQFQPHAAGTIVVPSDEVGGDGDDGDEIVPA